MATTEVLIYDLTQDSWSKRTTSHGATLGDKLSTDPPLASKRRRSYGKPDESGVRSRRCGTGMVHTKGRARHGYRPSGAPPPLHLPPLGYSNSAARHLSLAAYADGCVSRDQHPGSDSRLVL